MTDAAAVHDTIAAEYRALADLLEGGGAHQDAAEWSVGPADVGVRQGAEADVT